MVRQEFKTSGFTLIELLVVISIIALLLSILMPSLNKVRAQAQQVACASNFRQWGLGADMYCSDNDEKYWNGPFPEGRRATTDGRMVEHSPYFGNALKDYCQDPELRVCPATSLSDSGEWGRYPGWGPIPEAQPWWPTGHYGSYAENMFLSPGELRATLKNSPEQWRRRDNLIRPDLVPIIFDSWSAFAGMRTSDEIPPVPDVPLGGANGAYRIATMRHGGYIDVLMGDSSVKRVSYKGMWWLRWHKKYRMTEDMLPVWDEFPWLDQVPDQEFH